MTAVSLAAPPLGVEAAEAGQRITAQDLVTLRDIEGLSVSPDGEWAAFQTRTADPEANAYDTAWVVISTGGGAPRRLAGAGDPLQAAYLGRVNGFILPVPPVWSPDYRWIAYVRKDNGRKQVWRSSRDGGQTEQLSHNDGDVRVIAYSKDGLRLLFETEPSRAQLDAALAEEGREGFLYDNRFFPAYSPLPVLPKDVAFGRADGARSTQAEEGARHLWVYEFAGKNERAATQAEQEEFTALTAPPKPEGREVFREPVGASPAVAVSSAGALAWTEARDPELQGGYAPLTIVAQPTGAEEPIVCAAAECTSQLMEGLWWRGEDEVVFLRREGPVFQDRALYAWKPGAKAPRLILRTGDVFTSPEWKCAVGGGRLICFYEEPARPRRLVAIDLDSGSVETLYDPNPDYARFDLGAKPRRLLFHSPTGVENYGYLVLPPDRAEGERLPLVIVTYRCYGFLRGGTGDEYPVFPLAAQGHAVLCFNVPETDWAKAAREDHFTRQNYSRGPGDPGKRRVQEGLDTAIAHLDEMGVIDPAHVGVTGLSFGAETVSYALFNRPSLAAGIASGTEVGPASTFLYGPAGRESLALWGLGSPTSQRWDTLSIARNADKVRAPLLLNVADHELIAALEPVAALEEAGRAVEMYVFPDEHHIKWQPAHRLAIYDRNIDWMNFWLRGAEDEDPRKVDQYERWRAMRARQCELFKGDGAPWYCGR